MCPVGSRVEELSAEVLQLNLDMVSIRDELAELRRRADVFKHFMLEVDEYFCCQAESGAETGERAAAREAGKEGWKGEKGVFGVGHVAGRGSTSPHSLLPSCSFGAMFSLEPQEEAAIVAYVMVRYGRDIDGGVILCCSGQGAVPVAVYSDTDPLPLGMEGGHHVMMCPGGGMVREAGEYGE